LHNYNGRICWDGENECSNFTSYNDAAFTHTYASGGTYTVSVTGTFEALSEWDKGSLKMISVENLGSVGWKTFKRAFYNAYKLKTFTAGDCDTSNVTSMQQMFKGVWYITDLDMKGFNTSKVTSMQEAFAYLVLLTELDVSNFDTSNVTNMHGMFRRVEKVTNLDVSNFNTSKVTNLSGMFDSMNSLTSLDVSNFNISNLISLHDVFDGLESIVNLDLSSFNTSGIEDMSWMFAGSKNLKTLNLSGFDMSNVNNVEYMFFIVSSLTDIIYSKTMSPAEYGNFLSKINIFGANLKDNGTLHIGSNTCGSDATCLSAKATLEGKGWEFSSN
jgi:surface protein